MRCGPGIGAEFDLLPYFFLDEKVSKKSSRNEASTRPARIGRSLGMLLTAASLGSSDHQLTLFIDLVRTAPGEINASHLIGLYKYASKGPAS